VLALADTVRRWHAAQRPADLRLEVLPGVELERRWVPLESVGVYVPRRLLSTLVMCAVPAQVAGVERIVVVTPPEGAGLVAAAAELLGVDEVWAIGGPQAVAALAYGTETIPRVAKIVGPGSAYVNEAKLLVSRDVAIDLPAGPSEVVVLAGDDADPQVVELELAAQREHGADSVCRLIRLDGDPEGALAQVEEAAPEHLVLLGERAEAFGTADPERRRGLRRTRLTRGSGRLRDGGQPCPSDRRLGEVRRRARARGFPQAGHDPAADRGWARTAAPGRRGARGGRGDAGARGGGAAVRTLPAGFAAYRWAPSTEELATRAGLDPVEIVRFDGNVPADPLPSSRPGAIAGALAEINTYPHGGYGELVRGIAAYAGVEPENVVLGAGADDLILLCARAFAGPGDTVELPPEPTYPLFRIAVELAGAEAGDDDPAFAFCCRPNNPSGALDPLPATRPARRRRGLLRVLGRDGGAPSRRRRHRPAHLLESVRARRRAGRLRARRRRDGGGAEPAPGAGARVDALRGARARRSRRPARRATPGRGARASRR